MNFNNPAGRLLRIIDKGKKIEANVRCKEAWSIIFNLEKDDLSGMLNKYSYLVSAPSQIRELILNSDGIDSSLFLEKLPKVENAFSVVDFSDKWSAFMQHFDETTQYSLRLCDDYLNRTLDEKVIDSSEIDSIINDLNSLIENTKTSTIDDSAKDFIITNLSKVKSSLLNYEYLGAEPIQNKVYSSIGELIVKREKLNKRKNKELLSKFWKLLLRLALLTDLSLNALEIGSKLGDTFQITDSSELIIEQKEIELDTEID